ncbi:MAG: SUMF1/EgtB/PvdO family nonheme iron enzyme [Phycisphaerae bacterium]|nr:SUMF1/EgtB/PvdO family nonheme iron enzyme [Phycisphaerae bacterium]
MNTSRSSVSIVLLAGLSAASASAAINIETVTVSNAGNVPDARYGTPGCGAVDYVYDIGRYEVTAGQYTAFLNAVAASDTHGLYDPYMVSSAYGCQIQRFGSPGNYTYSVEPDWADRPVNHVSWGDAARFSNWLANGQPSGGQDLTTTEDGSYYLGGATSRAALMAVTRKASVTWVIPSEDEWYKAAYHKNDPGAPGGNYWDYPTGSDSLPSNGLIDPDPGSNAAFCDGAYTIGSPYWRTEVGEFENSESPYGTFDQGGNVWEWNETTISGSYRGLRGGSFNGDGDYLHASHQNYGQPTYELFYVGFRVALIPEPATIAVLAVAGVASLGRKRSCWPQ